MGIETNRIGNSRGRKSRSRAEAIATAMLIAIAIAGCGETKPSRFYVLSSVADASQAENSSRGTARSASLGVGPIELPRYLDRVQIVSFATPNLVDISEFDRWAEPLGDNFTRVLGENLEAMLPATRVDVYPFMTNAPRTFERQVLVDVSQFRLTPGKKVELRANWNMIDPNRRRSLASGSFTTLEPIEADGAEAVVASMSRAVGALSRDIAAAVKAIPEAEKAAR